MQKHYDKECDKINEVAEQKSGYYVVSKKPYNAQHSKEGTILPFKIMFE